MLTLRYLISFIIDKFFVLLAWVFAPILATCYTVIDGREWLVKPLRWFQTHDNPLDEWRVGNYYKKCNWLNWDFNKPFHRYLARYFWLCRNPAYGFAQALGIVPQGDMQARIDIGAWDSATTNYHLYIWDNCFLFKAQIYYTKRMYLRLQLGWKGHAGFDKYMLAGHINPFRCWKG